MPQISSSLLRAIAACGLALSALPVWAGSSVVSVSSESVGSSSTSIERSSASISGNGNKVAQGDYKVLEVAALEQRPDMLRVHLQATAGSDEFYLLLPRAAAERGAVATGQTLHAQQRPYGLAFATAAAKAEPFFLVLDDAWYRELDSRPVEA